ncbi:MAG: hypothetical protein ACYSTL_00080 [Planctomycetota bacterium]|jgi:hypothetical protein
MVRRICAAVFCLCIVTAGSLGKGTGKSPSTASAETLPASQPYCEGPFHTSLLQTIRKIVAENEAAAALIKADYTEKYHLTGFVPDMGGVRRYDHCKVNWAQDGPKQYFRLDWFYAPDKWANGSTRIIDGKVMKSSVELAQNSDPVRCTIAEVAGFEWFHLTPGHLGFRPFGQHLLSELLVPEFASVHDKTAEIDGCETYVIDVKKPGNPCLFARIWLDRERGMPLRIWSYDKHPGAKEAFPRCRIDSIKLHQLPNSGWFPVKGVRSLHFVGMVVRENLEVALDSITIRRKDIPDSLFKFEFPGSEGTGVYSAIEGTHLSGRSLVELVHQSEQEADRELLIGKPLPKLDALRALPSPVNITNKAMLVCFWNMEQQISRTCLRQLADKAEELESKGVGIVAIHTAGDEKYIRAWAGQNKIRLPLGIIPAKEDERLKTLVARVTGNLPWLILTDAKHIVRAEGFQLKELDEKLVNCSIGKTMIAKAHR